MSDKELEVRAYTHKDNMNSKGKTICLINILALTEENLAALNVPNLIGCVSQNHAVFFYYCFSALDCV